MQKRRYMLMINENFHIIKNHVRGFYDSYPTWCKIGVILFAFFIGFMSHDPICNFGQEDPEDIVYAPIEEVENKPMENKTIYTGGISNGKRHGWGSLTTTSGNVYEGEWFHNRLYKGTLKYWDNDLMQFTQTWLGSFNKQLSPHGFGKMVYTDSVYIGCYEDAYRNGIGRLFYKDGRQLFGMWKRGLLKNVSDRYHPEDSVYGIDISRYQNMVKEIDWDNLALYCDVKGMAHPTEPEEKDFYRPVDFVMIQATRYAKDTKVFDPDPYYYRNLQNARDHYIKVGSYHVFTLVVSAQEQAEKFLNYMKREEHDLPPMLDVEGEKIYSQQKALSISIDSVKMAILNWLTEVEQKTGQVPLLYANNNFVKDHIVNDARFDKYMLWIARYAREEHKKVLPDEGLPWTFWQFASEKTKAKAKGVHGFVDIDKFDGSYNTFIDMFP